MLQLSANAAPGYQFENVPNLSTSADRERLSESAMAGFFAIADKWKLTVDQQLELLGGTMSRSQLFVLKTGAGIRKQDELTRVSYLIGIFKALNILLSPERADQWMTRPNRNTLFKGQTPLQYAVAQGIPGLQQIRRLLDASRGGV